MSGYLSSTPRGALENAFDMQHRMLVSLIRRNGGRLTFSSQSLFGDVDRIPPIITFVKDDVYRTVEVVVEGEEPQ